MNLFIVDAFSNTFFGGNPAGVVIYNEHLDEHFSKNLAAELRYSETAFVKQLNEKTYSMRYFTPNSEVDLCGHATIAAFTALKHMNMVLSNETYIITTKAGNLEVFLKDDFVMLEQAPPCEGRKFETSTDVKALCSCLGISTEDIGDSNRTLIPQIISTGLQDIILPVKSRKVLDSINPDFKALSECSKAYGVVGVHAFTLDSSFCTAHCRNFAPLYGIDEESATGTSNGALTYYLFKNKIIFPGKETFKFIQGEKMNRPSEIYTRLLIDKALKILVGGNAKILAAGDILV